MRRTMLTGSSSGERPIRNQWRRPRVVSERALNPRCVAYDGRLRRNSLAPSKTPPTASAAGTPKPIRGAGALRQPAAVAQGLGRVDVVAAFWANAGTALRHSQIINVNPFISKLLLQTIIVNRFIPSTWEIETRTKRLSPSSTFEGKFVLFSRNRHGILPPAMRAANWQISTRPFAAASLK
jgi:hypothetical protein